MMFLMAPPSTLSTPSPASHRATSGPAWEIATLFPEQGDWTEEEYLSLTDSINRFIELADGVLEFPSMPTLAHQYLLLYILDTLRAFVLPRKLGQVIPAVFRIRVGDKRFREPDIAFLSSANNKRSANRFWSGADLVIEIVSDTPEDRKRDHVDKRADYAAAGIAEYWIIDPQDQTITVYSLAPDNTYPDTPPYRPGQHASSKLLPGFSLDVAATFAAANPQV